MYSRARREPESILVFLRGAGIGDQLGSGSTTFTMSMARIETMGGWLSDLLTSVMRDGVGSGVLSRWDLSYFLLFFGGNRENYHLL